MITNKRIQALHVKPEMLVIHAETLSRVTGVRPAQRPWGGGEYSHSVIEIRFDNQDSADYFPYNEITKVEIT